MSAQAQFRLPAATSSRRHPFSNAGNHPPTPAKEKPQQKDHQRQPSSPPLPRQNSKTTPPSPPKIISDKSRNVEYQRVGFLGEVSSSSYSTHNGKTLKFF
jgi:cell cycle serine/threonine-protein kinase CDC5/MSD2